MIQQLRIILSLIVLDTVFGSLMVAVTDTGVRDLHYCIRTLPNKLRTYGSSDTYFKHSDDSAGNFGNCVQENDDGADPPANQTYPSYVTIDSNGVISLNDPPEPTDSSGQSSFTYYFSCQDLNTPGTQVRNNVQITVSDHTIVSSTISEVTSLSAQATTFVVNGITPFTSIQKFYDNIQDSTNQCGYTFTLSDTETDSSSFPSALNQSAFQANNDIYQSSARAILNDDKSSTVGSYLFWIHAISESQSGNSIVQGPITLGVTKMVAVTSASVQQRQYCIRSLPNKTRTYGSAIEYFKNSDDSVGNFGNCMQESTDDGGTPTSYPNYVSIDAQGVITLNDPTSPIDPPGSDTFTYYFSCEDQDALGARVRNQVEFTINNPAQVSSSIQNSIPIPSNYEYKWTVNAGITTTPFISISSFYDIIVDTDKHCGYTFHLSSSEFTLSSWHTSFNQTLFELNNLNYNSNPVATLNLDQSTAMSQSYYFWIVAVSDSSSTEMIYSNKFQLSFCEITRNLNYTTVETPQTAFNWKYPGTYGNIPFFQFYQYECIDKAFTLYELSTQPDSLVAPSDLYLISGVRGFHYVNPIDSNLLKTYNFYIVIMEEGTDLQVFKGPFSLIIKDCTGQMVRYEESPAFNACLRFRNSVTKYFLLDRYEFKYKNDDFPQRHFGYMSDYGLQYAYEESLHRQSYGDCQISFVDQFGNSIQYPDGLQKTYQLGLFFGSSDYLWTDSGNPEMTRITEQKIFIRGNYYLMNGLSLEQYQSYNPVIPFEFTVYYTCKDLECPNAEPVLQWKKVSFNKPSDYFGDAGDLDSNLQFGRNGYGPSATITPQYFELDGINGPFFNITNFTLSINSVGECGFTFQFADYQYPNETNAPWPEFYELDALDSYNWCDCQTIANIPTLYMKDSYKTTSSIFEFYLRAVSDTSNEYFLSSEKFTLWSFNSCYDQPIIYQMAYPFHQNVDVGRPTTYFKFLLFTCDVSSIPVPQYDFEYKVYEIHGVTIHQSLFANVTEELRIEPFDPNTSAVFEFQVEVIEQTKPIPYTQFFGPFSLQVTCNNNKISANVFSNLNATFQTNLSLAQYAFTNAADKGWYVIEFSNFTHFLSKCDIYGYYLSNSTEKFLNYTDIAVPNVTIDGFSIRVYTKFARMYNFSIYANDSWGNFNQTEEVKIYIQAPPESPFIQMDQLQWPPMFQNYNLQTLEFRFQSGLNSSIIDVQIPSREDLNGDQVFMTINSDRFGSIHVDNTQKVHENQLMSFDNSTSTLTIRIEKANLDNIIGSQLEFILQDNSYQELTKTYEVSLSLDDDTLVNIQAQLDEQMVSCNNSEFYDSQGQGCDWYEENPQQCGAFDKGQNLVIDNCCACNKKVFYFSQVLLEAFLPGLVDIQLSERYELEFKFNQTLWQPTEKIIQENFHEKIIELWIESAIDGSSYYGLRDGYQKGVSLHNSREAEERLRFTWTLLHTFDESIRVQLHFEDPYSVSSTSYGNDVLYAKINHSPLLKGNNHNQTVDIESLQKQGIFELRLYPPSEQQSSIIKNFGTATKQVVGGASFTSIVTNVILNRGLQDVWGMLNTQQLIVHLGMVQVPTPSNAQYFCEVMSELTQKDMYPTDEIYPKVFEFSHTESYNLKFEDLGYEGTNFVELSGSATINITLCILIGLFQSLMLIISKRQFHHPMVRRVSVKLSNDNFFAVILRVFLSIYLEMAFSFLICFSGLFRATQYDHGEDGQESKRQLKPLPQNFSDKFSNTFAIVSTIIIVALPIYILKLVKSITKSEFDVKTKNFAFLFSGLRKDSKYQLLYQAFFMLRRAIYALVIVFLTEYPILQITIHILTTLSFTCYLIVVKPFEDINQNRQEVFNEICTQLASYCTFLFLDTSLDSFQRRTIGWIFIGIVILVLILNLTKVILSTFLVSLPTLYRSLRARPKLEELEESWQEEDQKLTKKAGQTEPLDHLVKLEIEFVRNCFEIDKKAIETREETERIQAEIKWYHEHHVEDKETLESLLAHHKSLKAELKKQRRKHKRLRFDLKVERQNELQKIKNQVSEQIAGSGQNLKLGPQGSIENIKEINEILLDEKNAQQTNLDSKVNKRKSHMLLQDSYQIDDTFQEDQIPEQSIIENEQSVSKRSTERFEAIIQSSPKKVVDIIQPTTEKVEAIIQTPIDMKKYIQEQKARLEECSRQIKARRQQMLGVRTQISHEIKLNKTTKIPLGQRMVEEQRRKEREEEQQKMARDAKKRQMAGTQNQIDNENEKLNAVSLQNSLVIHPYRATALPKRYGLVEEQRRKERQKEQQEEEEKMARDGNKNKSVETESQNEKSELYLDQIDKKPYQIPYGQRMVEQQRRKEQLEEENQIFEKRYLRT